MARLQAAAAPLPAGPLVAGAAEAQRGPLGSDAWADPAVTELGLGPAG